MGEIADALKRARSNVTGSRPPVRPDARPNADLGLRESADLARREAVSPTSHAPAGVQMDALSGADPAIIGSEGPGFEACSEIAMRVRKTLLERNARSVAVVSAVQAEGKTTTSSNLALALAALARSRSVALVDLDMRKPSVARVLGIRDARRGIEVLLRGGADFDEVRAQVEQPQLDVFPTCEPSNSVHELLRGETFHRFFDELERRYDVVVVDTPPVLPVPDAIQILERVSCCIPVARSGTSRVRSFKAMIQALPESQILGTLLNGARTRSYRYSGYGEKVDDDFASADGENHESEGESDNG